MRAFEAGKKVKLTKDIEVTLGSIFDVTNHPSGTQFDGPAVIVAAYRSNKANVLQVVALADPAQREVTRILR